MSAVLEPPRVRALPVQIYLTPAMLRNAAEREREVLANLPANCDEQNYTGLSSPRRYFKGYAGEYAVASWLRTSKKQCEHRISTNGQPQGADFILHSKFGDAWKLEVKAASEPWHKLFLVPVAQSLDFDICLSVRLDFPHSLAEIMGVISVGNVRALPVVKLPPNYIPSRSKPFVEMTSADALLELIE